MINAIRKLVNGDTVFSKINTNYLEISGVPLYTIDGNVYWLKKEADTDYVDFYNAHNYVYSNNKNSVYTTIDSVFAAAGKNDTIIIMAPDSGGHDLTDQITISTTQFGLRVFGAGNTMYNQRVTIKNPTAASDVDMFLLKTDKLEFSGLCFQNRKAGACMQIGDTAGQAYYQIYVHDCNFTDYGGVATFGITPGSKTGADTDQADPVNLVVEKCFFDGFVTSAIVSNGTRDAFIGNEFLVAASANGIHIFKHTDSRGKGTYRDNYFYGPADATTMAIKVTDIGSAVGHSNIFNNYCVGFTTAAVPITKQTYLQGGGNWYSDANGQWVYCDIVA